MSALIFCILFAFIQVFSAAFFQNFLFIHDNHLLESSCWFAKCSLHIQYNTPSKLVKRICEVFLAKSSEPKNKMQNLSITMGGVLFPAGETGIIESTGGLRPTVDKKEECSLQIEKTLQTLCALPAVSGFEEQAAQAVAALLRPLCDTVEVDHNGNVLGYKGCGRKHAKTVLLDAHLDQIGFVVTEVLDGGFLRFAPVGGVDPRMLLATEVTILADEPLYGVVSCMPPHLLKAGEQDKAVPVDQMLIDTGLENAKEKIRIGTPIVFAQQPVKLLGGQICSKCLDDRAGVAAILLALEKLKKHKKRRCNIAVLISAQEEVTGLGAQTGAFAVQPEYAIAVDVTHGKTPDGPSDGVFELGSGPAIGVGPNLHRGLTKRLIKTAKANDIDYSLEVMEGNTGTNAWTMQIVAHGIATALLSIPEKYMHTPVEVVKTSDVEDVAELMYRFLCDFDGEVEV